MKVTTRRPEAIRTPVEVTKDKYELWYLKPIMLGTIQRDGKQWFTEDGMRFASSHDALDYLIRLRDSLSSTADAETEEKFKAMIRKNKSEGRRSTTPIANGASAKAQKREASVPNGEAELFRQFKAFMSQQKPTGSGRTQQHAAGKRATKSRK